MLSVIVHWLYRHWAIENPVQVLKDCIEKKEWFKGIVLSTAFFEGLGIAILKDQFRDKIAPKNFDRMRSVQQIIILLFASGLIRQHTYSKMLEVNEFRNNLVHFPFGAPQQPLKAKEAQRIIRKAISCLKILGKQFL
ncbi:MAG: hypothetical protein JSV05_03315 [Candidatus Bathyarchaeota archaeon]|nr:MAG: hypothetical protein JSV05_03315 [Candidatus Bathyarchaeota archaeon]